jgi:hypothetical protein
MAGDRTRFTTTGALGNSDLTAAAKIIADRAKELAGAWSATIPARIQTQVAGTTATVSSDAPPAYPNEITGVRHPVFGPTEKNPHPAWVTNQHRPFLSAAADEQAGAAMARYAKKVDKMCRQAGFR